MVAAATATATSKTVRRICPPRLCQNVKRHIEPDPGAYQQGGVLNYQFAYDNIATSKTIRSAPTPGGVTAKRQAGQFLHSSAAG